MKPLPKLALVGHTYAPKHNREKAAALSRYFEVCCFVPDCSDEVILGRSFAEFDDAEEPKGEHQVVTLQKAFRSNNRTQLLLKGFDQALSDWQPDFVLVEAEPWAFLRWQVWFWCRKNEGAQLFEFTWENLRRTGWKGLILDQVYRLAAKTNRGVVCGNEAAKALFIEAGQAKEDALVAAQLGIPDEGFPVVNEEERAAWRGEHEISLEYLVLGFCGRFIRSKGLLLVVEAMQELKQKGCKIKLALLGHGELKEQIAQALGDDVLFFDSVGHREVPAVMKFWDLLVLPSQRLDEGGLVWEEQFGRVIIEAVACGVPAIGSRHGAIPEVLGVSEAVFEEGAVSSLAAKIEQFAFSTQARADLLAQERAHVFEQYTHTRLAARYAEFLAGTAVESDSSEG